MPGQGEEGLFSSPALHPMTVAGAWPATALLPFYHLTERRLCTLALSAPECSHTLQCPARPEPARGWPVPLKLRPRGPRGPRRRCARPGGHPAQVRAQESEGPPTPRVNHAPRAQPLSSSPSVRTAHQQPAGLPRHLPPGRRQVRKSAGAHSNGTSGCYTERIYPRARRLHQLCPSLAPVTRRFAPPPGGPSVEPARAIAAPKPMTSGPPYQSKGRARYEALTRFRRPAGRGVCRACAVALTAGLQRVEASLSCAGQLAFGSRWLRRHLALAGHVVALRHQRPQR